MASSSASIQAFGDDTYLIMPIEKIDVKASHELQSRIEQLARGPQWVYASKSPNEPVPAYWGAQLSPSAFRQLKGDKLVAEIIPNKSVMVPFADYKTDPRASAELRMVSQPPGAEPVERFPNYVYRSDWKRDIFIYHAEVGINADHEDFRGRKIEWLYTGYTRRTGQAKTEESSSVNIKPEWRGHSTCTASKATGIIYGAAKDATLVVVKMPDYTYVSYLELFQTITDDIRAKDRRDTSIVSVSFGSEDPRNPLIPREPHWILLEKRLKDLALTEGVPVVMAAGDNAEERDKAGRFRLGIDTYPAYFTRESQFSNRMIAASNCNLKGERWRTSQYQNNNRLFAPGVDIKCASAFGPSFYQIQTGTSFSAPLVAGVLANMMATGEIVGFGNSSAWDMSTVRKYAGWQRPGGEYVLWNHVDRDHNPPMGLLLNSTLFNQTSSVDTATS